MASQLNIKILAMALSGSAILFMSAPAMAADGNVSKGKEVYGGTCIYCHGANGKGEIPGAPDFTKKNGVLSKSDEQLITNITNGFESFGAVMPMPAKGGNPDLTDEDIANVLAFMKEKYVVEKSK